MTNTINTSQNKDENIDLLKAQQYLYKLAKKYRNFRIIPSIILSLIIAPIIIICFLGLKNYLIIFSAIWLIIDWVLGNIKKKIIDQASKVQEQFDVNLYNLEWNTICVGKKLSYEKINDAKSKYSGNSENLMNWYSDLSGLPQGFAILICQRSNLYWDINMRNYYTYFLIIIFMLIIGFDIALAFSLKLSFEVALLGLFLPSGPILKLIFSDIIENRNIAKTKERIETNIVEHIIKDCREPSMVMLRQNQDQIYNMRNKSIMVPEFLYNFFRKNFEKNMRQGNDYYKKIILEKL